MAGLFSKVARFASSPQGQAALAKAKAAANDPKNRAKLDDLVGKAKQRAGGFGQSGDRTPRDGGGTYGTTTTVSPVEPESGATGSGPAARRDLDGPGSTDDVGRTSARDTRGPAGS